MVDIYSFILKACQIMLWKAHIHFSVVQSVDQQCPKWRLLSPSKGFPDTDGTHSSVTDLLQSTFMCHHSLPRLLTSAWKSGHKALWGVGSQKRLDAERNGGAWRWVMETTSQNNEQCSHHEGFGKISDLAGGLEWRELSCRLIINLEKICWNDFLKKWVNIFSVFKLQPSSCHTCFGTLILYCLLYWSFGNKYVDYCLINHWITKWLITHWTKYL